MTSKLVVNTIEADTGISSVSFASSISMSSTSKFHFGDAGIDIGADTNINRPAAGVLGFNINNSEKLRIDSSGRVLIGTTTEGSSSADTLTIAESGNSGITIRSGTSNGGHIYFSDGTSGADEYRGIVFYDHTSNYMSFWTNGDSEKLRITSGGDLLLGGHSAYTYDDTGASNVILDIYGGATAGKRGILSLSGRVGSTNGDLGTIWFNNDNNSGASPGNTMKLAAAIQAKSVTSDNNAQNDSGAYLQFFTKADGGSLTEKVRFTETGKVNIGGDYTASTYGLQVYGSGGNDAATIGIKNNTAGPAGIHLLSGHGNWSIFNSETIGDALEFRDESAGATRAMIDSSGRLLLGTTSVGASQVDTFTMETSGHTGMTMFSGTSNRGTIAFGDGRSGNAQYRGVIMYDHSDDSMRFNTSDAERLRITSSGHVQTLNNPSFRAGLNSNTTFNQSTDIVFNDTGATWHYNRGGHYNTSNGRFTAPVTGVYQFNACVIWYGVPNNTFMGDAFHFYVNGGNACYSGRRGYYNTGTTGNSLYYTDHMSVNLYLNATDYVHIRQSSGVVTVHGNTYYTWFAGSFLG